MACQQEKETEELATRLVDKHKEVVDILEKYSEISDTATSTDSDSDGSMTANSDHSDLSDPADSTADSKQDSLYSASTSTDTQYSQSLPTSDNINTDQTTINNHPITQESYSTIFNACDNVILILGNILNPDGSPHEWMIQRVKKSVELLNEYNLDLSKTIFIPSGSDVSNQKYTYDADKYNDIYSNYPHPPEAQIMANMLHNDYNIPLNNIILESQARTTLENICFCFEILYVNKINLLKNFFIVSSDWHIKRAELNFNLLYTKEKEISHLRKMVGNMVVKSYEILKWFECNNIKFIGAKSNASKERFEKDNELRNAKWVKPQAKEYSDFIWKWREMNENDKNKDKNKNKDNKDSVMNNSNGEEDVKDETEGLEGLDEKEVMEVFAFSTAIEHLYLRLEGARNGLNVKELEKRT